MTGTPQTAMQPEAQETQAMAAPSAKSPWPELAASPGRLRPGMVLARDIVTHDGVMLLSKEFMLDESLIVQIQNFAKTNSTPLTIFINPERR